MMILIHENTSNKRTVCQAHESIDYMAVIITQSNGTLALKKLTTKPPQSYQCSQDNLQENDRKLPDAAAPQTTPQTRGGQVTGFIS